MMREEREKRRSEKRGNMTGENDERGEREREMEIREVICWKGCIGIKRSEEKRNWKKRRYDWI